MLRCCELKRCLITGFPKCWPLKPHMPSQHQHVLCSFLGNATPCSSSFHTWSSPSYGNHKTDDIAAPSGVVSRTKQKSMNPAVDHDLMDQIYGKRKGDSKKFFNPGSHQKNAESYFKSSWQRKLNVMGNSLSSDITEKSSVKQQSESDSANTFGMLTCNQEIDAKSPRTMDLSDPNDRISKQFPDDTIEDRDWRLNIPLKRYGRLGRGSHYYYGKISRFGREGKVNEAIQVFEDWMMVQDRVMPNKHIFVKLIAIVGRAGYTKKAFQLFRQMKHLGLEPPDKVYTSLFNACANSPVPDYGLKHALSLYNQMALKGIPPNPITVKAAVKAFALCGDFSKSFQILDETKVPLDVQCFSALLMACIADKESGFRRALKVMQLMRQYNIQPTHYTYNLFLRCIRDCGVGNLNTLIADLSLNQEQQSIPVLEFFKSNQGNSLSLTGDHKLQLSAKTIQNVAANRSSNLRSSEIESSSNGKHILQITEARHCGVSDSVTAGISQTDIHTQEGSWRDCSIHESHPHGLQDSMEKLNLKDKDNEGTEGSGEISQFQESPCPNSIIAFPNNNPKFVSLSDLRSKSGRLAVVGGAPAVISHMKDLGVEPDVKTFTQILACVPNDAESDDLVIGTMKNLGVTPDVDFLNDVMMRRNMRHEKHSVKEILPVMAGFGLIPNMRTYAALALTCHRVSEARDLLDDMKAAQLEPTAEVMSHLLYISRLNFKYKVFLLQEMEKLSMQATPKIIGMIEKSIAIVKHHIVTAEQSGDTSSFYLKEIFQSNFKYFLKFYQSWLKRTELHQQKHPWDQYESAAAKTVTEKEYRPYDV